MSQKKLMVVGGGEWQVPIIRKAKEMGLFVISSSLYPDSPGFRYADAPVVADALDLHKQLACANEHRPDGIVTDQSDIGVPTTAYLCQQLGLPGIGVEKAELFTNKCRMREFLLSYGYNTPAFQRCDSPHRAAEFARQHGYPVVLKPDANQASRGVFRVNSEDELLNRYPETIAFSRDSTVLVEQFIAGTELTVEGFKTLRKHYSLAVSCKKHLKHNPMVASTLFYSPTTEGIDYAHLKREHDALVENMELPFGITHAEYIHSAGKFYLIDIAARGGGTKISSDIVPAISGVATNRLLISMALGERIDSLDLPVVKNSFALLAFFNFEAGKVRCVTGLEQVKAIPGVLEIALDLKPGQRIEPPADDRGRHGYFIAIASARKELESLSDRIRGAVRLVYE
jgi:carbamoyl-phosphate synthase large subunit